MTRLILLAGALALATPSLALAQRDPSNPAAAPLSPTKGGVNQPTQGEVASSALPAAARESMEKTPPKTGDAAEAAEKAADDQAREEAAKPKAVRTVRMGTKTVAVDEIGSRQP